MTKAEALELLKKPFLCCDLRCYSQSKENCERCEQAFDMAIEALQREPKWIPVTERLPEEEMTVLICASNGEIEFGQLTESGWEWLAESLSDYWTEAEEVIAWQPLPEPYRSE